MSTQITYNDTMDAEEQLHGEETIASIIFDQTQVQNLTEQDCSDLGRRILNSILWQFRRDLFTNQHDL